MNVIFVADQTPEERQWALILVAGGDKAYNCWDTLENTVEDRKKVDQVWNAFVTGITDSGRSYETQVEATGGQLMRNRSHIRPRSPDIPHMHASFLQRNSVPSATSDGNALSERENSVISGCQQLANGQKTVLSANRQGSIKQTNTSQVLVSETVPDRRVQPSRRGKMTRFGDKPVSSTVSIPPRRQLGRDTSTKNRREFNQADKGNYKAFRPQRATTIIQ